MASSTRWVVVLTRPVIPVVTVVMTRLKTRQVSRPPPPLTAKRATRWCTLQVSAGYVF